MKIAINTRFMIPGKMEGFGYFIEEVAFRMVAAHPEHEFYFLFDRAVPDYTFPSNVHALVVKPPARHPLLWYAWYNLRVPLLLKKIKADVFVSPDGFCSTVTTVPQCLVVHDLAFLHYPSFINKSHLWYYKRYTPLCIDKAKQVATVSEFSRQDMVEHYGVEASKIDVVYSGTNPVFRKVTAEEKEAIKQKFSDGAEYFVYTGSIHPRKNLIALLRAFSLFKKRQKSNMKLLVAGRMTWKNEEFRKLLSTFKFRNDVVLTGYLSKEELARVVASAYALVYPSLFEGFGVPPLEALQCGVPAIVSRVSSLPEIGGNAYLYINPESHEDLAEKMMLLYKDETLRSQLVENGQHRLELFTWNRTAELLWESVKKAAGSE